MVDSSKIATKLGVQAAPIEQALNDTLTTYRHDNDAATPTHRTSTRCPSAAQTPRRQVQHAEPQAPVPATADPGLRRRSRQAAADWRRAAAWRPLRHGSPESRPAQAVPFVHR
jgi:hypothetical protein